MDEVKRKTFKETWATIKGFVNLITVFGFGFLILSVISLERMFEQGALESFRVGNVPIPSFHGAGASNLEVFIQLTRRQTILHSAATCRFAARQQNAAVAILQQDLLTQSAGRHVVACHLKSIG